MAETVRVSLVHEGRAKGGGSRERLVGGADAAPNQRCLGQVAPQKPRDTSAPAALGADYAQPFIVAPCLAKDGEEKVSAWNKFQRFCFVIETPEYLQTTLPEPKKTVEGQPPEGNCRRADE